ncbi:UDP-glucose 4-epimerase GalE [Enterobacter hormaechei]|uniref:UDP-glucose 4-epimerase GalE n=1 Tax=Enterobacter hormaechei TaxID=158836 RepID=UPI00292A8D65|nr:UDP-glucose 4-epimerase GalE [Enterobacter hormaechei]ELS4524388.1 UDP-glucose 4-epimerase GalE [Enterobacter hormaechei]MDV1203247.1 UDP-glucose 4-epimerase GalE [Enterobacter hormaechei]MDV1244595.1 UDP-glucose 4-epimerase GalE [Enterobacter hormaechei]MDV1270738.1 UDP-glucose 4-epimerase GalE [Enterobacter hormaechei]MDV1279845.1 UDP-glucose 4-epimerase GalE [Enterobacter hormaechei]
MTILVTGGTGFIGAHTVIELLQKNYNVVILDNFVNSSPSVIDSIETITGRKVKLYEGNVCDKILLKKIFNENTISHVLHFAGLKSVNESIKEPLSYYENNVQGTLTLVGEIILAGINNIIFSSSATVYGIPECIPLTESCSVGNTANPYGTSKYMSEVMLTDIARAYPELNVTLLRYFNPAGAHNSGLLGESPKGIPNNLVPYLTLVAAGELEYLSVFGNNYPTKDGTGVRDFIHVMDLAAGHLAAIENKNKKSNLNIYNLGTGKGYSVLELIHSFEKVTGVKVNYQFCDRRPGDVAECWSDPSLAQSELRWRATRTLDDMMVDAWNWAKKNKT